MDLLLFGVDKAQDFIGFLSEKLFIALVFGIDRFEELVECHHPILGCWRDIGRGIKRLELIREEERGGPATGTAVHQLIDILKMFVNIGPFFSVHFDGDEVVIECFGDSLILERLPLHHMAPVAAAVTDREKDRFILSFCFLECFITPGIPVDRIVGMLLEIGGVFVF